ncbi:FMN-binding protein [Mesorhizobium sp. ORM6]
MKPAVNTGTKPPAHGLVDGTYTGPVADAYYGLIQIQASIQGGRLTSLKVLKYPNDRRTSISINRQALPILRDEAISAQSANVDIVSGATLTSRAFIQSLGGALKKASS